MEKCSDCTIVFPQIQEAFLEDLVPTTSTTVSLVIGDALAVSVARMRGFTSSDFAIFHPNGLLGRKLTMKVSDLMKKEEENAIVSCGVKVQQAVLEMCKKPIGCVNVIDEDQNYVGIFTDGDLRRLISRIGTQALEQKIEDVMTRNPLTIIPEMLVVDVVEWMKKTNCRVSALAVVESGKNVGTLCIADIAKAGLI